MSQRIDQDHRRFREIVRGKIKQNLRKYISQGEMIGRKGKETVSIPLPSIDIPHFRYGQKQSGGVGQGEGKPGDSARRRRGAAGPRQGRRQRGRAPPRGRHLDGGAGRDPRRGAPAAAHRAEGPGAHRRAQGPLHGHPHDGAGEPEALPPDVQGSAQASDLEQDVRSDEPDHRAHPRRQALPLVEERCRCRSRTPSSST